MKKTIYIQADENDGDYLSNECTVGEIEIEAIKKLQKQSLLSSLTLQILMVLK